MAHGNEREFLRRFLEDAPVSSWPADLKSGRVLNVGAAAVPGAINYASLFPEMTIVGCDQTAGEGVDLVCDLTGDCTALGDEQFSAILCCSVLEHCQAPWLAAASLLKHLRPGGLLYITVPWVWRFHPYPSDYWRLSIEAIQLLFPNITWKRLAYATQHPGEFLPYGAPHDNGDPWRQIQGQRVVLVTQFACAIGRKPIVADSPAA